MNQAVKRAFLYLIKLGESGPTYFWLVCMGGVYYLSVTKYKDVYYALWALGSIGSTVAYGIVFYGTRYAQMTATEVEDRKIVGKLFIMLLIGVVLVIIFSVLAAVPSLVRVAEAHQFDLGGFKVWFKHKYFPFAMSFSAAIVPLIFGVLDWHLGKNIPKRHSEFTTYVFYNDTPACATMLVIASLSLWMPDLEIFSAGAHAFQFTGFNMAFAVSGFYTFVVRA